MYFFVGNRDMHAKDRHSSDQILTVTKDSLKRSEQDLNAMRTELSALKREQKEGLRQLETIQFQLSKGTFITNIDWLLS